MPFKETVTVYSESKNGQNEVLFIIKGNGTNSYHWASKC
jgi:hypothetical protein